MSMIRINRHPSRRQLLHFAVAWLVFFSLLAALLGWKGAPPMLWQSLLVLSLVVPAVGFCKHGLLRPVYLGMAYAAWPVGMVVSHAILVVIYYIILTPTGLLLRLAKPGFFPKKPDPKFNSYWLDCRQGSAVKDYFKPY